ncbi:MAG: thioredoxin family protein [Rhodoferax sp.]
MVRTEQLTAELMAYAPQGVAPGQPVWVGLQFTHAPQWHTYWKNSGDSGQPPELRWTLPAGVHAGDIVWPIPKKIPVGTLANYGFEGTTLLPVPLTIGPEFAPGPLAPTLSVKLSATWLVCRQECIPQEGEFSLNIPVRGSTALNAMAFEDALKAQPTPLPAAQATLTPDAAQVRFEVTGLPAALVGQTLELFPEVPELIETAAPLTQRWDGARWQASMPIAPHLGSRPTQVPLLLVASGASGRQGWGVTARVQGTWPSADRGTASVTAAPERAVAPQSANAWTLSFGLALLGAFVGGMVLNLMPCVFPVLTIKAMGIARHGPALRLRHISALAYGAGVVVSFLALGALLLALRGAGEQLGWGFQLQSPGMVAALALLFTLIGLNLAGVFEVGQAVPGGLASVQLRHPALDSALSGVLAVLIASPCTAPFMGASLGLALSLPPAQALLIFATLGLGMALPYMALSVLPGLAQRLPKPGAWMQTFRQVMAFPMFATVVWLVWVLGQQTSIDGAAALLLLLLAVALVAWSLGCGSPNKRVYAIISVAITAGLTWAVGPYVIKPAEAANTTAANSGWQAWSPQAQAELQAQGRTLFVDFTAAWCVTCQVNKKTTLSDADVLKTFAEHKGALLRADWTRRDPAITQALAALGRSGVPVYAIYRPGAAPVVLSELISPADIAAALGSR